MPTVRVQPFDPELLPQVCRLVNLHLSAAILGWALSEAAIARHLERNDQQPVTDRWVAERTTLCAVDGSRVLAAAHLLRYGAGPDVGASYRDAGALAWVVTQPDRSAAAATLLAAARAQLARWHVRREYGWDTGLPAGPLWGVPDAWPHVAAALEAAGYRPDPGLRREALYAGWLSPGAPPPGAPPVAGLRAHGPPASGGLRDTPGRHPRWTRAARRA